MKRSLFILLFSTGVILFLSSLAASGIVGSYIIDAENIEDYLVFTQMPVDKTNISDIDKYLYAFNISVYPYIAAFSAFFILIITFIFFKTKKSVNTMAK